MSPKTFLYFWVSLQIWTHKNMPQTTSHLSVPSYTILSPLLDSHPFAPLRVVPDKRVKEKKRLFLREKGTHIPPVDSGLQEYWTKFPSSL